MEKASLKKLYQVDKPEVVTWNRERVCLHTTEYYIVTSMNKLLVSHG